MPMSRNRGSGSGPFLMEMVIAAGFFMLCVAMCLSAFVQADRLSKNGRDLNRAVLAAESLVEEVKAGNTEKFLVIPCLMTIFRRYLKNGKLEIRMQMQCISP